MQLFAFSCRSLPEALKQDFTLVVLYLRNQ